MHALAVISKGPTFHIANVHIARIAKEETQEAHPEIVTMLKLHIS